MPDPALPSIHEQLIKVMNDIPAVQKKDRHASPGANFDFRGIDAVMNAVGPMFRKYSVLPVPDVLDVAYETVTTTSGKASTACRVKVRYTFYGPAGDNLAVEIIGEAWDGGDKGTAKAMSVAYRTCLLQLLCLPTDEPDPDHSVYERAERPTAEGILVDAMKVRDQRQPLLDILDKVKAQGLHSAPVKDPDNPGQNAWLSSIIIRWGKAAAEAEEAAKAKATAKPATATDAAAAPAAAEKRPTEEKCGQPIVKDGEPVLSTDGKPLHCDREKGHDNPNRHLNRSGLGA